MPGVTAPGEIRQIVAGVKLPLNVLARGARPYAEVNALLQER